MAEAGRKTRSVKGPKEKDFGGPGKSRSGYFIYGDEVRGRVMDSVKEACAAKGTSFKIAMVGTTIGNEWKKLGEAGQKKYQDQAAKEKLKTEAAQAAWKQTDGYKEFMAAQLKTKDGKMVSEGPKEKDFGKPDRPLSGYFVYTNEMRNKVTADLRKKADASPSRKFKIADVAGTIGKMWKELSDAAKAPYQRKADVQKEKAAKEDAEWKKSPKYLEFKEAELNHKKKLYNYEKKKMEEIEGAPEATTNAFAMFSAELREQRKANNEPTDFKTMGKLAGTKWAEMNEFTKKQWEDKAAADEKRYQTELKEFKATEEGKAALASVKKAEKVMDKKRQEITDMKKVEKEAGRPEKKRRTTVSPKAGEHNASPPAEASSNEEKENAGEAAKE